MRKRKQPIAPETPFGLKPDYEMYPEREQVRAAGGPNMWEMVKQYQYNFGDNFDFRILDDNVFFPTCLAAQHWIYNKFPEDSTYYTLAPDDGDVWVGVVVDRGLDEVLAAARRDGLVDEADYEMNMRNDMDARAGE